MGDLPAVRARFETWFKMNYPLFGKESPSGFRDTTLKHHLWTAWQAANLGDTASLATCRAEAKAEGIGEAAAVCRKEKGKWMQLSHEEDQCERCEKAILALLPPDPPA